MRLRIQRFSPLTIFYTCLVLGLGLFALLMIPHAQAAPASGERLITIHDRGHERGIITRANTLRQVFKETNVTLDKNDIVEPGLDETLVTSNYQVNIYRARPIVIVDGPARQLVMSAYQTPKQIAEHAGVTLRDEDKATLQMTHNMIRDGASEQMIIDRALPVRLTLYGKENTVYTQATTVEQFMREKDITLGKKDTISKSRSAEITANMKLDIWRNGKQTATKEEAIPFEVEQVQDANHEVGYRQVKTPGVKGKKMVTYEIVMRNGHEVSRKAIQTVVTKQPSKQVEVVGIKVNLPSGSHEDWMAAAGISSGDFGYVNYIVEHEGGWAPCKVQGGAINCAYSGYLGYGLVQATPGDKMASAGGDWRTNPITQLRWATGYAIGRYGSWSGAYNYWLSAHRW